MNNSRKFLFTICTFLFSNFFLKANQSVLLSLYEDSLHRIAPQIFQGASDEVKQKANSRFLALLEKALKIENSFDYNFDSLTDIGRLKAPDGTFKIFNWNLPHKDGTHEYFGFIQRPNPKTKKTDLFFLNDKSAEIKNPESQSLDDKKWYGALYYKIIRKKSDKTVYYTLLGWDGNNNLTWKKIIEVLWFDKTGSPKFGESIFVMGKLPKKRIIFEFRAEMIMALKYNEEKGVIIFDNLAPESPQGKGIYENYVMDGSYNAFEFKNGKWQYLEAINALNPKSSKDKFYLDPHEDVKSVRKSDTLWTPKKQDNPNIKRGNHK